MKIKDAVVLVTGGASGLGEATVRHLHHLEARTVILDLNDDIGKKLKEELGNNCMFIRCDITIEENVRQAINKVMHIWGKIQIVINCAGVADSAKIHGRNGPISMSHVNKVVQINLLGTIDVIRLTVEHMMKNIPNEDNEKGLVINTASVAAFDGQIGQIAYSASKAAVVGLTLPLARECADYGIRVMAIAPGVFRTPMIAAMSEKLQEALGNMIPFPKRLGKPLEYAQLVHHIIVNPMLNGEVIRLDGAVRMAAK